MNISNDKGNSGPFDSYFKPLDSWNKGDYFTATAKVVSYLTIIIPIGVAIFNSCSKCFNKSVRARGAESEVEQDRAIQRVAQERLPNESERSRLIPEEQNQGTTGSPTQQGTTAQSQSSPTREPPGRGGIRIGGNVTQTGARTHLSPGVRVGGTTTQNGVIVRNNISEGTP